MTPEERQAYIDTIRNFPAKLEALISELTEEQCNTHYIAEEWSVRQIIHHLADSHLNSVIRLKLILTEDRPPLKGYDQEQWAELADVEQTPISTSIAILKGLHARWAVLFESLDDDQRKRVGVHSEIGDVTPDDLLRSYAEHGEDHIAQIRTILSAGGIDI